MSRTRTTRSGPPGYVIGALYPIGNDTWPDEWEIEHLTRYHGWPGDLIEGRKTIDLERMHDAHHKAFTDGIETPIAIPHGHTDIVPMAIEASEYSRELKDALLAVIDLVDVEERYKGAAQ